MAIFVRSITVESRRHRRHPMRGRGPSLKITRSNYPLSAYIRKEDRSTLPFPSKVKRNWEIFRSLFDLSGWNLHPESNEDRYVYDRLMDVNGCEAPFENAYMHIAGTQ